MKSLTPFAMFIGCAVLFTGCATHRSVLQSPPAVKNGAVVMRTAAAHGEDPYLAGKAAAAALQTAMGGTEPHIVLMVDCYDEAPLKKEALKGVASVFPKGVICGGASYGSFTQGGSLGDDAVTLLGIGGDGIAVRAALEIEMGAAGLDMETQKDKLAKALTEAGARLAIKVAAAAEDALLILVADAHSPKNQFVIDGVQSVVGKTLPITGGSVNKNAGQTFVIYRGKMFADSALAIVLNGDLKVAQTGRQAKSNDAVLATAMEGSAEALKKLGTKPVAALAFDCGGRMGKLDNLEDELKAIQESIGKDIPLFGCYCAGEFGPADASDTEEGVAYGRGWHIMFTVLGQ